MYNYISITSLPTARGVSAAPSASPRGEHMMGEVYIGNLAPFIASDMSSAKVLYYVYAYIYIYICIYIHICIERETYTYIYIYIQNDFSNI